MILKQLEAIILTCVAVFAPTQAALLATFVLIVIDLAVGLLAAHKRGTPITSAGIKRTVGKILLYEIAICVSFLVQTYLTGDILPASKMVTALIGMVELKSIMEGLDTLNGSPVFKSMVSRIVQTKTDSDKKSE